MSLWRLDAGSGVPLYLQLKQQVIQKIIRGDWEPGHQLPTVRQMAVDVSINVNTVSRVYAECERDGFIRTQQGKGTFVRHSDEWAEGPDSRARVVEKVAQLVSEMAQAQGISLAELQAALAKLNPPNHRV